MTTDVVKRIELRGGALDALKAKSSEILLSGPAGTGKSFALLLKMHLLCMSNPGMRGLMVRKTHRSLTATGLVTFRDHVAAEAIAAGICKWYGGSGERPAQYIYSNGSVLLVGGLDNPEKIMSMEIDAAYAQEATELTLEDWEKITTRLRNGKVRHMMILADCNPQQPSHWLKKRCDEGRTTMLYSRHEDNPRLAGPDGTLTEYGATYLARLDALTGVRKERLRYGRWAAAEGIIYADWRPEVHLSDRKVLPQEWMRLWSVDFGFRHPFCWQMWAVDPDGRLWLEKEIYRSERLVEDHARDILNVVTKQDGTTWKYPRPRVILCDHDAEDRATLERHLKLGTVAATKSVSDGIQAVQARLRIQKDGKPRLFILRDSLVSRDEELANSGRPVCTPQEIEGYVWKPQPNAVAGRERPIPDEPEKINDDGCDAMRYAVAYFDLAPRPRIRIMG